MLPVAGVLHDRPGAGGRRPHTGPPPASGVPQATCRACPRCGERSLLSALYVLSDFGAVSLLRFDSFTRVIYTSYRASFDRTTAAVLSMVLVVLAARWCCSSGGSARGPRSGGLGSGAARAGRCGSARVAAVGLAALGGVRRARVPVPWLPPS